MTKKKVFDKPLDCGSDENVDKTWRKTIIEGLDKKIVEDGIFFGTPKEKSKDGHRMMVVAIKSDEVEPNFMASVMEMLPRTFLMKIAKTAVWSEKGSCYGAELMNDDELETVAKFVLGLVQAYMKGLDPETIFPKDKNLQKRWNNIITKVTREAALEMMMDREKEEKKSGKSTLEELADE